jgi:hypothetical protein
MNFAAIFRNVKGPLFPLEIVALKVGVQDSEENVFIDPF